MKPASARRYERALALEHVRRVELGLAPHPALAHVAPAVLAAAAARYGADFRHAAYFAPHDDRRDPHVGPRPARAVLAHARRVCQIVSASALEFLSDGTVRLHHQIYGSYNALCRTEPFWEQPTVMERRAESYDAFGYTGYLLAPHALLTCWHGWEHMAYEPQFAVFDYAIEPGRADPTRLPADRVRAIAPYPLARAPAGAGESPCDGDWVVLRLEERVSHLADLPAARVDTTRRGRSVYTLGHPRGLPLKLATSGRVLAVEACVFRTDLDTYVGNSGSPVFDARTHALVGVVIEGQKDEGDFEAVPSLGCYVSNRIDGLITGQSAVKSDAFASAVTAVVAQP